MKPWNILIACEESQAVCIEMRKRGHNAFSCDIIECSGGHPEWHIKQDVLPLLNGDCEFVTCDGKQHRISGEWDLVIAHPPCTFLTVAGNRWFNVDRYGDKARQRKQDREKAIAFFMAIAAAKCKRIAIENPIGVMSTVYKKPNQVIQPYEYGHQARKATCLWLKELPCLEPTNIVGPGEIVGKGFSVGASLNTARDENGKIIRWNDPRTAKIRSRTYPGIARAMAAQWTPDLREV